MAEREPGELTRAGSERRCAACGDRLAVGEWCPVVTRTEDDGVELYAFCDTSCRADWERDSA